MKFANCLMACVFLMMMEGKGYSQVVSYYVGHEVDYSQTSDDAASESQSEFQASITPQNSNNFTSVSLSIPGASSPTNLTYGVNGWGFPPFGSISYPSEAALYAADPDGTYTFNTTGGTYGPQTYSISSPGSNPNPIILTGTSLENLADDDPASPITVTYDSYTTQSPYSAEITLFHGGTLSFIDGFTPTPGSTSFTFPGDTFSSGQSYTLWFSNYNDYQSYPGDADYFTLNVIDFTAGIPEPSSFALVVVGFMTFFLARRLHRCP